MWHFACSPPPLIKGKKKEREGEKRKEREDEKIGIRGLGRRGEILIRVRLCPRFQ